MKASAYPAMQPRALGVTITHTIDTMATTQATLWNHPKTDIDRSIDPSALNESYTLRCRVFCHSFPAKLERGTVGRRADGGEASLKLGGSI